MIRFASSLTLPLPPPHQAGEIAEHFNEYLLLQGQRVVDRARTYRGYGMAFY